MSVEWVHIALIVAGWMVGAAVGIITGTWKFAATVAKIDRDIRKEFTERESRLYEKIAGAIADREAKLSDLAFQFDETLKALRQKINDVELNTTKYFVSKGEVDDFRAEYREDMRDLKKGLNTISTNREAIIDLQKSIIEISKKPR